MARGRWAKGLGRIRVRLAPFVGQGRRNRFSGAGWGRSPPLRGCSRRGRGVVGNGRVQLGRGWREGQRRRRLAGAGLRGGQFLQRAFQALIHLIQVNVIQISGGQVETAREALHLGFRGRRAGRGELTVK